MNTHKASPGARFAVALGTVWVGLCTITGLVLLLENKQAELVNGESPKSFKYKILDNPRVATPPPITKMQAVIVDPNKATDQTKIQAEVLKK